MRGLAARVVAECDQEFRSVLRHWGSEPDCEAEIVESIRGRILEWERKADRRDRGNRQPRGVA